jgi:hypothetical protein
MYQPPDVVEISALCFSHQYRRVGLDLTRFLSGAERTIEDLECPDRAYPNALWGESVVHAFRMILRRFPVPPTELEALAEWQLEDPERPPIRLLSPESLDVYKKVYPEEGLQVAEMKLLQVRPPAFRAEREQAPKLESFVESNTSLLYQTQQAFAILFYNFLLHHDVIDDARVA